MDSTLQAGLIGLGGSLIGALASYFGSKRAATDSINAQKIMFNEQREREHQTNVEIQRVNVKTSARIIYIDTFTTFREVFRIQKGAQKTNVGKAPENISISSNFSDHIARLSIYLSFEEQVLVNKLYGLSEKLKKDIMNINYIKDTYSKIEFNASIIGVEVFGEHFFNILRQHDFRLLSQNDENLIDSMTYEYKPLFKKLRRIIQED